MSIELVDSDDPTQSQSEPQSEPRTEFEPQSQSQPFSSDPFSQQEPDLHELDHEATQQFHEQLRQLIMQSGGVDPMQQQHSMRGRITLEEDDEDVEVEEEEEEEEEEERTYLQTLYHNWKESGMQAFSKNVYRHAAWLTGRTKVMAANSAWWLSTTVVLVGVPLWFATQNQFIQSDIYKMESELHTLQQQVAQQRGTPGMPGSPIPPPPGASTASGIPLA